MSGVITTVVDQKFQHYIPLWVYCIFAAYPEYHVKVWLSDEPTPMLLKGIQPLWRMGALELVEGEFKRYEHHPPRFAAWLRYLLFTHNRYHYWRQYDWVYITDADLMMVRQEPPLHVQHQRHMDTLGLPYSNMLRDPMRFADKHLTGLHFCSQEFIKLIMPKCTEYDGLFRVNGGGVLDGKPIIYDERLLYQIVRDAGMGMPPHLNDDDLEAENSANYRSAHFRPWHGINIGRAMSPGFSSENFVRASLGWWQDTVRAFVELSHDDLFWRCYGYMTPKAKRALKNMVEVSGFELRAR